MTFAILGAGFGRTGTASLKAALESLGVAPCYHMIEVARHPEHARVWAHAQRGDSAPLRALLSGYAAAVDWPAAAFWREILTAFPGTRVILTVRDGAAWYASFRETIFERAAAGLAPPPDSPLRAIYDLTRDVVLAGVFGGRADDERHARAVYDTHHRDVVRAVAAERLLVFDLASGWQPLCAFLDRPVPGEPFPHVNARETFLRDFGIAVRRRRVRRSPQ